MMKTQQFIRKPYVIDAIQVTEQNIHQVATWCQGDVRTGRTAAGEGKYVKVRVHRALNERQTKAFIGDWVLYAGTGFKVYTPNAFAKSFDEVACIQDPEPEPLSPEALKELTEACEATRVFFSEDTCKHGEPKEFCQDDGATPKDCESVEV